MNNYDDYSIVTNTEALKVKTDGEKLALSSVFTWTNNNLCALKMKGEAKTSMT